jgi:hypothetical protein
VKVEQHYGGSGQWIDGDFSGDGLIGFADLVDVAQNYGTALPAAPIPKAVAGFDNDRARALASVPEPGIFRMIGMIGMIGIATLALLRRRSRSNIAR